MGSHAVDASECKNKKFEVNSLLNSEPVKVPKVRKNVAMGDWGCGTAGGG